jgi:hypothetical protein
MAAEPSRRALLGAGAGLIGLLLVGAGTESAEATTTTTSTTLPQRSHYAKSVKQVFTATSGTRSYRLTLTGIKNVSGVRTADAQLGFNLIFTAATAMPEGIYSLRRSGVPTHTLFLSPVGARAGRGATMQALVNRTH